MFDLIQKGEVKRIIWDCVANEGILEDQESSDCEANEEMKEESNSP